MYLQTLLSYGSEAKSTHLRASGWCIDEAERFDDWKSSGYQARKPAVKHGAECDFVLPLNVDIFSINKLLPDTLDIDFTFHRTKDSIPLRVVDATHDEEMDKTDAQKNAMSTAEKAAYDAWVEREPTDIVEANKSTYKIKLKQLTLIIRRILLQPSLVKQHQQLLNGGKLLRYPITRTEVKELAQIPAKTKSLCINQLYSGRLPNNIIIGLLKSKALMGDFSP